MDREEAVQEHLRDKQREEAAEWRERLRPYNRWTFDPHFSDGSMHDYDLPIDDEEDEDAGN